MGNTLQRAAALSAKWVTFHRDNQRCLAPAVTECPPRDEAWVDVFSAFIKISSKNLARVLPQTNKRFVEIRVTQKTINNNGQFFIQKFPIQQLFGSVSCSALETVQMYDFYPTVSADQGQ
ncbi:hypothetical protein [Pseudomonas congelans]|uniref:hypothetical protein n=1 Tax=Pseudomonas congelans TaxID=200452 RepID=UPI001179C445|nr:hypothetical protein [Pseudomonas congelans]